MTGVEIIKFAGSVCIVIVAISSFIFPVMYSRSKWRDNSVGRDQMYFSLSWAAVMVLVLTSLVVPFEEPWRISLRFIIFLVLVIIFPRRIYVLWQQQRYPKYTAYMDAQKVIQRERTKENSMHNFSWARAKKFYFALIAFGGVIVSNNVFEGSNQRWATAIVAGLGAAAVWLFPQEGSGSSD